MSERHFARDGFRARAKAAFNVASGPMHRFLVILGQIVKRDFRYYQYFAPQKYPAISNKKGMAFKSNANQERLLNRSFCANDLIANTTPKIEQNR